MKYTTPFIIALIITINACSESSQTEKELREVLNTKLIIENFDSVIHEDSTIDFDHLRDTHKFLSIVYLQDGCQPCYPKFVEWHQKMTEFDTVSGYSVLFIIKTVAYAEFIENVRQLGETIDEKYYIIIDPDHQFVINNSKIPEWILNSSMLIDSENKIKMVGAPWVNEDMKNLFYKTVSNEQ